MIINFSVQNFGSIKTKQTLTFEASSSTDLEHYYILEPIEGLRLLKLGLIYGANASGKTTLLKALDFLRNIVLFPANKKTDKFDYNPFLFDNETPHQSALFSIDFVQNKIRYVYEVELKKHAVVREELYYHKPNRANVFKRTTDIKKQLTEIDFGSKIKKDKTVEKILEANTLWNNTVLGGFLKTNIELFELKEATDWFSNYLKPLVLTGTELYKTVTQGIDNGEINKKTIIESLKKADFNISDIVINRDEALIPEAFYEAAVKYGDTINSTSAIIKNNGKLVSLNLEFEHTINYAKYILPFELESHGTQRYYGFAGLLSQLINESILFPIDELESSLHPDLYVHFILTYLTNVKNSQLIATTHNREILNNRDIFRNDVIWFTDKNEKNATELYSLTDFDSKIIRDTSNVYNAYKTGKLGGAPHLGDYYININDAG